MPNQRTKKPKTVIFLHIPKTAGTTLDQVIFRNYRHVEVYTTGLVSQQGVENLRTMDEKERNKYRLLKGHMSFGIHQYLTNPWAYFTFFRNPVERTISQFYFILRTPSHPIYDFMHKHKIDLKQCLEAGLDPMLHNGHTRLLSGVWAKAKAGECTQEHLEIAKENLRQVQVIGLTEQFDASLLLLGKAFGWNRLFYTRKNVTAGRPSQNNLSPETEAAVQQANQLDNELYAYAKMRFTEQIRAQGPDFEKQVNHFQRQNRFVRPLVANYWKLRKISVRTFIRNQLAQIRSNN